MFYHHHCEDISTYYHLCTYPFSSLLLHILRILLTSHFSSPITGADSRADAHREDSTQSVCLLLH